MQIINNLVICIFLSIIFIAINNIYRHKISNLLGLLDFPDNNRKFHDQTTPLIGSFPLILSLLIYSIFCSEKNVFFIYIFLISMFFFIVGLIDDKYNIEYKNRFLLTIFISAIFLFFKEEFLINSIYLETFEIHKPLIKFHSMILTITCVVILINTFNFTDGINALSSYVAIVWLGSLLLLSQSIIPIIVFLIICLLINSFFILKGNYFIGDSGTLFLSSFIAFTTVYIFNNSNSISYENIFLIFMIPGLDMIRLVFVRLKNKKNPFLPDRNHLHHFLIKKYSLYQSLLIYLLLMILPIILYYIIEVQLSIILGALLYFFIIMKLKKT